jgi:hypothetical protein
MAEDLNEIVARVTSQVLEETKGFEERYFAVGDLKSYLAGLGKGPDSAWEISYKTTSAPVIEGLPELGRRAPGLSAWEISYKTTSAPIIEERQKKA